MTVQWTSGPCAFTGTQLYTLVCGVKLIHMWNTKLETSSVSVLKQVRRPIV